MENKPFEQPLAGAGCAFVSRTLLFLRIRDKRGLRPLAKRKIAVLPLATMSNAYVNVPPVKCDHSVFWRTGLVTLEKSSFLSIMKLWQGRGCDNLTAMHLCRKVVDAVESRYSYKGLCKGCGCVCRHFQLLYLRRAAGNPAGAAYGA